MTLHDFIQKRIQSLDLPHPVEEYAIIQPVDTACLGRDIYLEHKYTGDKVWLARFKASELITGEVNWDWQYGGDRGMSKDKEILSELIKIRKLLEQTGSTNTVGDRCITQNKCLGCGQYHPQNTPCPHMMTYCGDTE